MIRIVSKSPADTLKIGNIIASNLEKGDVICLVGELGSGKTQLVKGIVSYFGFSLDTVNSPSFVLLKQYKTKLANLNHFDLFRLEKENDILSIGFQEYVYSSNISIIEWADRLKINAPDAFLGIKLKIIGEGIRQLDFFARGRRYKELIKLLSPLFKRK